MLRAIWGLWAFIVHLIKIQRNIQPSFYVYEIMKYVLYPNMYFYLFNFHPESIIDLLLWEYLQFHKYWRLVIFWKSLFIYYDSFFHALRRILALTHIFFQGRTSLWSPSSCFVGHTGTISFMWCSRKPSLLPRPHCLRKEKSHRTSPFQLNS